MAQAQQRLPLQGKPQQEKLKLQIEEALKLLMQTLPPPAKTLKNE